MDENGDKLFELKENENNSRATRDFIQQPDIQNRKASSIQHHTSFESNEHSWDAQPVKNETVIRETHPPANTTENHRAGGANVIPQTVPTHPQQFYYDQTSVYNAPTDTPYYNQPNVVNAQANAQYYEQGMFCRCIKVENNNLI